MLSAFDKIGGTNVDDVSETFCGVDDQIVVFDHLELTEFLPSRWFIKNTLIDCIRNRVVDEFR